MSASRLLHDHVLLRHGSPQGLVRWLGLVLVSLGALVLPGAADAADGTLTVTATTNAKIVASFVGGPVTFQRAGSGAEYRAVRAGDPKYVVWTGEGRGVEATVKSNNPWSGTMKLGGDVPAEAALAIESGGLRFTLVEPRSWDQCDAATPVGRGPTEWVSDYPRGVATFNLYYCLRVLPGEDARAFNADLEFTASQADGLLVSDSIALR